MQYYLKLFIQANFSYRTIEMTVAECIDFDKLYRQTGIDTLYSHTYFEHTDARLSGYVYDPRCHGKSLRTARGLLLTGEPAIINTRTWMRPVDIKAVMLAADKNHIKRYALDDLSPAFRRRRAELNDREVGYVGTVGHTVNAFTTEVERIEKWRTMSSLPKIDEWSPLLDSFNGLYRGNAFKRNLFVPSRCVIVPSHILTGNGDTITGGLKRGELAVFSSQDAISRSHQDERVRALGKDALALTPSELHEQTTKVLETMPSQFELDVNEYMHALGKLRKRTAYALDSVLRCELGDVKIRSSMSEHTVDSIGSYWDDFNMRMARHMEGCNPDFDGSYLVKPIYEALRAFHDSTDFSGFPDNFKVKPVSLSVWSLPARPQLLGSLPDDSNDS